MIYGISVTDNLSLYLGLKNYGYNKQ